MGEQGKGFLMQVQTELLTKPGQRELKTIPRIELDQAIIKKVPEVINDPQIRDHLRRLQDLFPGLHQGLRARQVDLEALPEEEDQDQADHPGHVNSLTQIIYYEKNILIYATAMHFFYKCTIS
jgi:hypothetical protein